MTEHVQQSIDIAADPDDVWKVVGDVGNVADWVPALEASRLEGTIRHATFAGGGGDATEEIAAHDDAARSYTYRYLTGPLPLAKYESTVTVSAAPGGSRVDWTAEFAAEDPSTEPALAESIDGIYAQGLASLQQRFSG